MTVFAPRQTELTATLGRELFDKCPELVDSARDVERWNRFVLDYQLAHQLSPPGAFPLQVDVELNSTCQLRCRFCLHGQKVVRKQELSLDTFRRLMDEGKEHGLVSVKLNYINEPLLRRDLEDAIAIARERGVLNTYFATNGLLLSPERSRSLIEAGLSKILVSIDAVTPDTYRQMRGADHYQQVVENIRAFIRIRREMNRTFPLLRVNFLQTAENQGEARAFRDSWDGVADMVGFQSQVAVPGAGGEPLAVSTGSGPFRCSFPSKQLVVDSSGDILPCCTFSGREMPVGNVESMTLKQAWDSLQMVELRRRHAAGGYREHRVCRFCVEGSP